MDISAGLPILPRWAVHLSGYPKPDTAPELSFQPHSFFVQQVCGERECKAVGWYNDRRVVYIDDKYRQREDSAFANSLIVHELVHYL